ncbi:hypothetical protein [Klebsiella pneumoniae]|uniref:hypothetical protein n=1 Tax=Klebsiella pneumoniae TaxID=573 RepID=UPI0039B50AB7
MIIINMLRAFNVLSFSSSSTLLGEQVVQQHGESCLEWIVIECLACPDTGTFFSSVIAQDNTWLIVWFEDGPLMQAGDRIEIKGGKAFFGFDHTERTIFLISSFKASLWKTLQKTTLCTGERHIKPQHCSERRRCNFKKCPYGLRKIC